jgi:ribosomal protein S18 acetylase RimI-like enzyme
MLEREFRFSDLPRLVELQEEGFPEENALYGIRPNEIAKVMRKLGRIHLRILLGLMRLVRRTPFRFPIIEENGRMVATTMLSFGPKNGYVSMVMVDARYRRRGYAHRLLETAQEWTRHRGKPYVVLDVLADNAAAIALYQKLGFRELRRSTALLKEAPLASDDPVAAEASVRPFAPQDASAVCAIAAQALSPGVAEVLPVRKADLSGGGWSSRIFSSDSAAWVVDSGTGPRAYLAVSVTPVTVAAHLVSPIIGPTVRPEEAAALVHTALRWVAHHQAPKVVAVVPRENTLARAALQNAGFRDALETVTLFRPSS